MKTKIITVCIAIEQAKCLMECFEVFVQVCEAVGRDTNHDTIRNAYMARNKISGVIRADAQRQRQKRRKSAK